MRHRLCVAVHRDRLARSDRQLDGAGILAAALRSFLAVAVAEPALSAVADAMAGLRSRFEGVRWVRPEGVHFSVHFFGQLSESDADRALGAVSPAVQAAVPFTLHPGGYGAFPERGTPRVLWLGLARESPALTELARGCRRGLATAGFPVDDRSFSAHCTLGRPRPAWSRAAQRAWRQLEPPELPPFLADRLVLFESRPGPGGSVYVERAALPFGGG